MGIQMLTVDASSLPLLRTHADNFPQDVTAGVLVIEVYHSSPAHKYVQHWVVFVLGFALLEQIRKERPSFPCRLLLTGHR